jgi:hypothetical protein
MEVITIESHAYKRLVNSISEMKTMLTDLLRQSNKTPEYPAPVSSENWITIKHACAKYHTSKVTINERRKLFEMATGKPMKRCHGGRGTLLFDESELVEALQLKINTEKLKLLKAKNNE